ncbi:hypothetical protein ACFWPU_00850 [Streptomyces sp. NPDC058471]|uniref:hypothetical protein n=1 Tax=Streptomyces sp. NPDC058471 TaxID=3346516 RepID=UPI00365B358B
MTGPTVMNLPIEGGVPENVTPLAAFVVLKVLDKDGDVVYLARATDGLTSVECLGMAEYGTMCLKAGWGWDE